MWEICNIEQTNLKCKYFFFRSLSWRFNESLNDTMNHVGSKMKNKC